MTRPSVDVIAIDLDGTLIGPDGKVSRRDADAVDRARQAGVTVLICTGRGLRESKDALGAIDQRDPVVTAGGSIVADPVSGETLRRAQMETGLVRTAVDLFHAEQCPALVLKDPHGIEYDYLLLQGEDEHPMDPTTAWWMETHGLRIRTGSHTHDDEHPERTVRVGMCAPVPVSGRAAIAANATLGDSVVMHDFPAVRPDGGVMVHILELFSSEATKWGGISWVCENRGLDPERTAAIGDQINDMTMIEAAGLSIAMGNAVDEVVTEADVQTATNGESGVALAIDRILSGEWAPRVKV